MSSLHLFQIVLILVLRHGQGTTNFALRKPANQSSTLQYLFEWTADKAVDGNANGWNPDNSKTCSATQISRTLVNNTWEVNVGFPIIMKTIRVYGRTDGEIGFFNNDISLYLLNGSGPSVYVGKSNMLSNTTLYVYEPKGRIASVVSLMKMGQIMVICEVTIEGECLDGMFSESCNETCGECLADKLCNKTDGTCPRGCKNGWKRPLCKEACERGKYGYDCTNTCGKCFYGNDNCSTSDGNCSNGCQAGWQGLKCDKECVAGTYGINCSETCGYCLNGPTNCSKIDGLCTGGCVAGYMGEQCKQGTEEMSRPGNVPNVGVIVGSVAVAVGVSVFAIAIIFIVKRRKKTSNEKRAEALITVPQYANLVVGNPDAAFKVTDRCIAETCSGKEERVTENIPTSMTNSPTGVMGDNSYAHSDYEQLQDATRSAESAYTTLNLN